MQMNVCYPEILINEKKEVGCSTCVCVSVPQVFPRVQDMYVRLVSYSVLAVVVNVSVTDAVFYVSSGTDWWSRATYLAL